MARTLTFTPGVPRSQAPQEDELESLWRTYYGATFNPARVNLKLMRQEAPQRYWQQMPEMDSLAQELAAAPERVETMISRQAKGAAAYLPQSRELPVMQEAAKACRGCDLHLRATQAVFGEGPANARIMMIGEQPGDQEDLAGKPFVGPAGEVLNRAICRGWARSAADLRHQCGEALRIRRAWQAAHSSHSEAERGDGLPRVG